MYWVLTSYSHRLSPVFDNKVHHWSRDTPLLSEKVPSYIINILSKPDTRREKKNIANNIPF